MKFYKYCLFSLVPLVVLLLIGEGISRVVCSNNFEKYKTSIAVQGDSAFANSLFTVWTNRPYYLYPDLSFSYNEYGMRVPPGDVTFPRKGKDDFYVFLLGGSAMAGMGSNLNGDWVRITGVGTHPIPEAIDGYLEKKLQQAMPDKRVKVFNAAVASHTLVQTRLQYDLLKHLNPDWIVSMDGVNDNIFDYTKNDSEYQQLDNYWKNNPVNNFPFVQGRILMRHSALCYLIGEFIFFRTGIMRNKINTQQDPAVLQKWVNQDPVPGKPNPLEASIQQKVDHFIRNLREFEAVMAADNQKHLMLLQPETSMRDPGAITNKTEKAVYNYYFSGRVATPLDFMYQLHKKAAYEFAGSKTIFPMTSLYTSPKWVFVDYCHFSREANEDIADSIAQYILSGGTSRPFQGDGKVE